MQVSEFIQQLQKFLDKYGDMPVLVEESGFGGYAIKTFGGISKTPNNLNPTSIEEPDADIIKELWGVELEEGEDEDDVYEQLEKLKPIKYLEISSGATIYST